MDSVVARWESKRGASYVELVAHSDGYSYRSDGAGGYLGNVSYNEAMAKIQARVDLGDFQPDANRSTMHRVAI